jgi:hypothetical protein
MISVPSVVNVWRESKVSKTRTAAVKPQRWLVVQASALLESVATGNYACYGRVGVPRYPAAPRPTNGVEPGELCVEMMVRAADGTLRLVCLDLTLKQYERTDQRVVWSGYNAPQHLQVIWVWDFFRIQSHVALRLAEPPDGVTPDAAWKDALDAVRAIAPGDQVGFDVRSACGDIHQSHALTAPATVWEPSSG